MIAPKNPGGHMDFLILNRVGLARFVKSTQSAPTCQADFLLHRRKPMAREVTLTHKGKKYRRIPSGAYRSDDGDILNNLLVTQLLLNPLFNSPAAVDPFTPLPHYSPPPPYSPPSHHDYGSSGSHDYGGGGGGYDSGGGGSDGGGGGGGGGGSD